jgi:cytidylate kinase
MRQRQRALGVLGDAVIEGRDIGSVVVPAAEVKVFLVADEDVRARRRRADRPGVGADELAADLRRRDEHDAVNTQPAEDAVVLDTTDLTIEQVLDRIEDLVAERATS